VQFLRHRKKYRTGTGIQRLRPSRRPTAIDSDGVVIRPQAGRSDRQCEEPSLLCGALSNDATRKEATCNAMAN